jgi:Cu-Zn family superoxide dismutase
MACRALAGAIVVCAAALAGCQAAQQAGSKVLGSGPLLEAKLASTGGSTLTGAAVLRAYDGGVLMTVNFNGALPGSYRVVVHANGNCSSLNGFSAGPPWAPPGVAIPSPGMVQTDDSASLSVRLPGYRLDGPDGIQGRAIVVHAGSQGSLEATPGVANNRVACGVVGAPQSLLAPFK